MTQKNYFMLVCWLWHCAATAVVLKRHERVNAFYLVDHVSLGCRNSHRRVASVLHGTSGSAFWRHWWGRTGVGGVDGRTTECRASGLCWSVFNCNCNGISDFTHVDLTTVRPVAHCTVKQNKTYTWKREVQPSSLSSLPWCCNFSVSKKYNAILMISWWTT